MCTLLCIGKDLLIKLTVFGERWRFNWQKSFDLPFISRIRLTAEGFLIPCLYFDDALSIKESIEKNDIDAAVKILDTVLANKPEKNKWSQNDDGEVSTRAFYETGGWFK